MTTLNWIGLVWIVGACGSTIYLVHDFPTDSDRAWYDRNVAKFGHTGVVSLMIIGAFTLSLFLWWAILSADLIRRLS